MKEDKRENSENLTGFTGAEEGYECEEYKNESLEGYKKFIIFLL